MNALCWVSNILLSDCGRVYQGEKRKHNSRCYLCGASDYLWPLIHFRFLVHYSFLLLLTLAEFISSGIVLTRRRTHCGITSASQWQSPTQCNAKLHLLVSQWFFESPVYDQWDANHTISIQRRPYLTKWTPEICGPDSENKLFSGSHKSDIVT